MRQVLFTIGIGVLLALAACGSAQNTNTGQPTLMMSASDFMGTTSLTVKAGDTVRFTDGASGGTHFLLTGTNAVFAPEAGAPAELSAPTGKEIDVGQSWTLTFATPGTYHITCTIHPGMNATIVVR